MNYKGGVVEGWLGGRGVVMGGCCREVFRGDVVKGKGGGVKGWLL